MPYSISNENNQYCVVNDDTGDVVACHDTQAEADAHIAALYANVDDAKSAPPNTTFEQYTYNGVEFYGSPVQPSDRDDKKYMRYVHTGDRDEARVVHWGQPGEQMERDNPESRANFESRHSCSEKRDPYSPGFQACWAWQPNAATPGSKSVTRPDALEFLSDKARELWKATYDAVFAETGDDMKAQLAAWGAVKRDEIDRRLGIKSTSDGRVIVQGWGMLFTDSQRLDLDEQYFNGNTLHLLEYYEGAPLFFNHSGEVLAMHRRPIGKRVYAKVYPRGIWVEHELYQDHPLYKQVVAKIKRGKLYYSSDTLAHMARDGYSPEDGYLGLWPVAGWSLTDRPAEPGLGPVSLSDTIEAVKAARSRETMDDILSKARDFAGLGEDASHAEIQEAIFRQYVSIKSMAGKEMTEDEEKAADQMDQDGEKMDMDVELEEKNIDNVLSMLAEIMEYLREMDERSVEMEPTAGMDYTKSLSDLTSAARSSREVANRRGMKRSTTPRERGVKSWGRQAPVQTGKAHKPSLHGMVNDLLTGKAHNYQIGPTGGFIVEPLIIQELLPELRSRLVLEAAGTTVTTVPDTSGIQLPKMTKSPNAFWVGVNQTVPEDEAEFATITAVPKPLAARVRMPIRMLRTMQANVEAAIRNEIINSLRLAIDIAGLRGQGVRTGTNTGAEPLGIRYTSGVNVQDISTNGRKPTPKDMSEMKARVQADNVELNDSTHWIYHPNVLNYFEDLTDSTGQLINRAQWTKGYDPLTTTQIPTNLGTGNDATEIYFGRWDYLQMVMSEQIELVTLNERFADSLQVGLVAFTHVDFAVHYPEAFEVLNLVKTS